jgi:hypothetical protein
MVRLMNWLNRSQRYSQRHIGEWKTAQNELLDAIAQMIGQYDHSISNSAYEQLWLDIQADWRVILKYISADRITTSIQLKKSDDVEAMLVSLHCLAVISWEKLYNKFEPEAEEDVFAEVSAAQAAVELLEKFGLMRKTSRGGKWTPEGIDMLNGKLR